MTLANTTRQNNLWSSKALSAAFFLCMLSSFLFTACGDEGTTENVTNITQMGVEIYSAEKDLPKCSENNAGEQAWIKGEPSVRICSDGEWFTLSSGEVTNGDFSCTTKELKDKSGLKIVCNGDSIGVVLNGEKGADGTNGTNGDDGAGCGAVCVIAGYAGAFNHSGYLSYEILGKEPGRQEKGGNYACESFHLRRLSIMS